MLRGVAVLLVLFRHMTPEAPWQPLRPLMEAGWAGVDLFFVLSGFLVSGILFREFAERGSIDYSRFFWRRGLKIYPAFAALLLIYGTFEFFLGPDFTWRGLLGELLFLQNYYASLWNHTWSLAIEEHFYLFAGSGLAFLAARRRMALTPSFAVAICIAVVALRCIQVWREGDIDPFLTHLRIDSLMLGVLLSYYYNQNTSEVSGLVMKHRISILLLSAVTLLTLVWFPFESLYWRTIGFSLLAAAFGLTVLWAVVSTEILERYRPVRILAFVGLNSYSVYLWHMAVKRAYSLLRKNDILVLPWTVELFLYVVSAVIVGVVMARLIEIPVLKVRDRHLPSRAGPPRI